MVLNSRIVVRQQQAGQDSIGQPTQLWVQIARVFANVQYESGAAAIKADRQLSTVRASVKVRRRPEWAPGLQVEHRGQLLLVTAVLPDEKTRDHVYLVCEGAK